MRSKSANKRWGHYKEKDVHTLTVWQVEDLRDLLQPGDKVKAEILNRLINRETAAAIRYTMEILEERIGRGEQG